MSENWIEEEVQRLVSQGKGLKMIKMAMAKRHKKELSDERIETLCCITESDKLDLSYFHFLIRLAKNDTPILDREGGIESVRKKILKINERIKKRFQRALELEKKRVIPIPLSKLIKMLADLK